MCLPFPIVFEFAFPSVSSISQIIMLHTYTSQFPTSNSNSILTKENSTSLIQRRPSYNMRIDLTQIKWRQILLFIRNRHKHRPINRRITRICAQIWLIRASRRLGRQLQLRICQVQLRHPCHKFRFTRRRRSDVRVIGANRFAGKFPGEENFAAGKGQGDRTVARNGRGTIFAYNRTVEANVVLRYTGLVKRSGGGLTNRFAKFGVVCIDSSRVRLIKNGKGGEILPRKASLVLGALANVRSKQCPCPGLWNTNFEPNGHGEDAVELSEDHLLSCFSGDRLK